jgi:transposase
MDVVAKLDLKKIEDAIQAKDSRGERPYSPRMMTTLLVYAYCTGVFSSRRMERHTYEDIAFRVICGENHPHFTSINEFRRVHLQALSELFLGVLRLCEKAGLVKLGHVSLDGSKVNANASKHKAMSYGRMKEEDKRLMAEIEKLLFRAEEVDREEDERFGTGARGDELPEELRFHESRQKKIREAMAALEEEAREARAAELREQAKAQQDRVETGATGKSRARAATDAAKSAREADELSPKDDDDDEEEGGTPLPSHRVPTTTDGKPTDKAQRNFTDPESRIMVKGGQFLQAYNAHAAVSETQVIVAHAVTNQPPDNEHLIPLMERVEANVGRAPELLTADAGYMSEENVAYCERVGIDPYFAVRRKDGGDSLGKLPMTSAGAARLAMHEKVSTPIGRETYGRRKGIVEPVFGQIKEAMGFRHFSMRGLVKAAAEWGIVCLCHNVLKLFRANQRLGHVAAA